MPLQLTVDSLESVPQNARDLYKEVDGRFRLDLEGYEDPVGLKSALQKEREAAKTATKRASAWESFGKTPEEIQEVLANQRDLEDQKLIAEKNFEELAKKRTERMQADHEKQLKSHSDTIAQLNAKAAKLAAGKVSGALTQAASKLGALPEAMEDIVLRGQGQGWTINDDGDVVAMRDGEIVLGKDGKSPLTPSEWAESLRDTAGHLWPKAQGTGATGSTGGSRQAPKGNLGGTKSDRVAAIASRFPELN